MIRKIFPVIMTATAEGAVRLSDGEARAAAEAVVAARETTPGG
jgi:proteasome beta subunit